MDPAFWKPHAPSSAPKKPAGPQTDLFAPPPAPAMSKKTTTPVAVATPSRAAKEQGEPKWMTMRARIRDAIKAAGVTGITRKELADQLLFLRDTVNGRVREILDDAEKFDPDNPEYRVSGTRGGEGIIRHRQHVPDLSRP